MLNVLRKCWASQSATDNQKSQTEWESWQTRWVVCASGVFGLIISRS